MSCRQELSEGDGEEVVVDRLCIGVKAKARGLGSRRSEVQIASWISFLRSTSESTRVRGGPENGFFTPCLLFHIVRYALCIMRFEK